jgi:hypothetical protein
VVVGKPSCATSLAQQQLFSPVLPVLQNTLHAAKCSPGGFIGTLGLGTAAAVATALTGPAEAEWYRRHKTMVSKAFRCTKCTEGRD